MSRPSKPDHKTPWNADGLDVQAFAQAGARLTSQEPLSQFDRLCEEVQPSAAQSQQLLQWQAHGELRPAASGGAPAVWLRLLATASVPLTCQRCLGTVDTPIEIDRWFRFVADEVSAAREDDGCEEDVLALEPRPNLYDLLEDELLMALPLVPMHDTCPEPVAMQVGDATIHAQAAERRNPFAELAKLKK